MVHILPQYSYILIFVLSSRVRGLRRLTLCSLDPGCASATIFPSKYNIVLIVNPIYAAMPLYCSFRIAYEVNSQNLSIAGYCSLVEAVHSSTRYIQLDFFYRFWIGLMVVE